MAAAVSTVANNESAVRKALAAATLTVICL
jgi:hypothetical protein